MDPEKLFFYVATAATAIWAVFKVIIPQFVQFKLRQSADEQEHRQKLERERSHYANMENAGWSSKISEILELDESFIREEVWRQLLKSDEKADDRYKAIEMVMARFENTLADVRAELAVLDQDVMKLREEHKQDGQD